MSLWRLVYYSAVIGGWAALIGWVPAELFFHAGATDYLGVAITGGMVGAAVGAGLSIVGGMANAQWRQLIVRASVGMAGGAVCGAIGITLGNLLYSAIGIPRAFGWLIMGLGIGIVDGAYERSKSKIRNGLIGGCIGGLIGGLLFDPICTLIASNSGITSRALGFVIVGTCIGAMIGLAQIVLKEAWLTVLDGYRAGRQLILSQSVTALGRGDHLPLPFLGPMNKDLESEHVRISRQANGRFVLEDNKSRLGTRLNNQPITSATVLKDGDVIKLGTNFVRFNERQRRSGEASQAVHQTATQYRIVSAPPPAIKRQTAPAATAPTSSQGKAPVLSKPPDKPALLAPASSKPLKPPVEPTPVQKPPVAPALPTVVKQPVRSPPPPRKPT